MKRRRIKRSRASEVLPPGPMGMARKCCVKNCDCDGNEARYKGLPLHKFPKDAGLRGRWLVGGSFDPSFRPTPGQFVCHRHFKRADYEIIKGHKYVLRKGSVPTIFTDYDNHPDPLAMPVKTITSYPQEDLDLINSEILNMDSTALESPLFAESRTSRSDSCGEAYNSRPGSSADSLNPFETADGTEAECHVPTDNNDISTNDDEPMERIESEAEMPSDDQPLRHENETRMDAAMDETNRNKEDGDAQSTESEIPDEKAAEPTPQPVNREALQFFPGARLEAKDFNEKWYSARVVETDWGDREVLIHFDKWSSRYDEWIPMDSSRLRPLQMQPRDSKMRDFSVGERILATWADGRKYPAKVNAVLENDRYDVLFDDGYAKVVRSSKMTKIASTMEKQKIMEGDSYIGSKQERRDKKRKHTVMELFQTHPRKRNKDTEKVPKKEDIPAGEDENNYVLDSSAELDNSAASTFYDSGAEMLKGFESVKPKVKSYTKKMKRDMAKNDTDHEDDFGPEWIDGEPQGIETFIIDANDGSRRSIIVADKRLPPIWEKHFTQRRAGTSAGKWDVLFVHKPSGKKFRSRNDIRAFMEGQGQFDFDPEKFDFCIHRRKSKSAMARLKLESPSGDMPKKIKTLLPKTKAIPTTPENSSLMASSSADLSIPITPNTTPVDDGAVFIGGLRVEMEDSAYKCPKEGCCKNFRKENLLQMHIKHYHPEYSKFLGSTPNVADLAYARTIGESIIDITPKKSNNNFLDKINKFEKRKAAHDKPSLPVPQLVSSPSQNVPLLTTTPLSTVNSATEIGPNDKLLGLPLRDDTKFEMMSPCSNTSMDMDDEMAKKVDATCAMSPGALFDLKIREEKTQVGIKTLLPVRPSVPTPDSSRLDRSKSLDEVLHADKGKVQRKRHLSEYSSEQPRSKGRQGMQEVTDDYGDLDDSALDAEGPAALVYRFSRRKSDAKSDENSQSSQLNDSRLEKADIPKGDAAKRDNNNEPEEGEGVMMMINGEMIKVEQLRREEIINCTCGFMEEDGLMIQCDLCLCWQHGHCNAIEREKDVPEKYICYTCRHPYRQRPSLKYLHDQEWLKDGKLASLSKRTKNQNAINRRTAMLKRASDLVAALLQIQQILSSIRVKLTVAMKKDHPKLYLWAKNWEKSEIPEATIEPVPVMKIIKPKVEPIVPAVDTFAEPKTEVAAVIKDETDAKSIASDTELMKILEEDSTPPDDTKVTVKKDNSDNSEGNILLGALTKLENMDDVHSTLASMEIKNEDGESQNDASTIKTSSTDVETPEAMTPAESIPSVPPQEPAAPLPPFIPEPEAPIDPAECRQRLLEHVEHFQNQIDCRLTMVDAEICVLEAMDPDDERIPPADVEKRMKQTVQMLQRDLFTIRNLAAHC